MFNPISKRQREFFCLSAGDGGASGSIDVGRVTAGKATNVTGVFAWIKEVTEHRPVVEGRRGERRMVDFG